MSFYHNPVMLRECVEGLRINPEGTYVDATFDIIIRCCFFSHIIGFHSGFGTMVRIPDYFGAGELLPVAYFPYTFCTS